MDAANEAIVAGEGYTFRLFYNNWTCAAAPFEKNECEEYMDLACSEAAPLDANALFCASRSCRATNPRASLSSKGSKTILARLQMASLERPGAAPTRRTLQRVRRLQLLLSPNSRSQRLR